MNPFSTVTAAALIATGAATVVVAQTPAQTDPSAASSPHQRQATGSTAPESATADSADPSAASSPSQRQATGVATHADKNTAVNEGATPASFVKTASQDGMTEVAAAKLALKQSSNKEVKTFAQKMIDDHSQADRELTAIAKQKGWTVPTELDAKHEAMIKALSAKSDTAFDSAFANHMAKDHTKAVALFESASNSSDPDLAAFAKKTLPTLQEHEQLANNLKASVGTRTASAQ